MMTSGDSPATEKLIWFKEEKDSEKLRVAVLGERLDYFDSQICDLLQVNALARTRAIQFLSMFMVSFCNQ